MIVNNEFGNIWKQEVEILIWNFSGVNEETSRDWGHSVRGPFGGSIRTPPQHSRETLPVVTVQCAVRCIIQ